MGGLSAWRPNTRLDGLDVQPLTEFAGRLAQVRDFQALASLQVEFIQAQMQAMVVVILASTTSRMSREGTE